MKIRPLTQEDIDAGVALSMQASWNHAAADWRRLVTLWPGQCLGGEIGGRVVASGTLATYESSGVAALDGSALSWSIRVTGGRGWERG